MTSPGRPSPGVAVGGSLREGWLHPSLPARGWPRRARSGASSAPGPSLPRPHLLGGRRDGSHQPGRSVEPTPSALVPARAMSAPCPPTTRRRRRGSGAGRPLAPRWRWRAPVGARCRWLRVVATTDSVAIPRAAPVKGAAEKKPGNPYWIARLFHCGGGGNRTLVRKPSALRPYVRSPRFATSPGLPRTGYLMPVLERSRHLGPRHPWRPVRIMTAHPHPTDREQGDRALKTAN